MLLSKKSMYLEQSPDENTLTVAVSIMLIHAAAQNQMESKVNSWLFTLLIAPPKDLTLTEWIDLSATLGIDSVRNPVCNVNDMTYQFYAVLLYEDKSIRRRSGVKVDTSPTIPPFNVQYI